MRVSPEQFQWRLENRISGAYQVSEPRTGRTFKAQVKRQRANTCENCGRETEFLFDGFVFPVKRVATVRGVETWEPITLEEAEAKGVSQDCPGKVCQRCRPLSELESKEKIRDILHEFNHGK